MMNDKKRMPRWEEIPEADRMKYELSLIHICLQALKECIEEGAGQGMWNRLDQGEALTEGVGVDICYQIGWNFYKGRKKLQRIVTNIRCSFPKP